MLANSNSPEDRPVADGQTLNSESSEYNSSNRENSSSPLLPRSPWNSKLAFLRAIFKAKKALDRIENLEPKKH
ncbi:hypothetical protein [Hyella patelloides]|uniref:hypothetical protein n=1 Tax=Hyella patelloides TaxID=1982969 RepID=UPI0011A4FE57|nr:hypothetical protein [Hyella patelloides]